MELDNEFPQDLFPLQLRVIFHSTMIMGERLLQDGAAVIMEI